MRPPRRPVSQESEAEKRAIRERFRGEEYLLVDGYNIIFAWDELKAIARDSLDAARKSLCDLLCNYQGYRKCHVILVFDAYKVKGGQGSVEKYHNIHVVYTREAETAGQPILSGPPMRSGRETPGVKGGDLGWPGAADYFGARGSAPVCHGIPPGGGAGPGRDCGGAGQK